ncbi:MULTISPECIES: hypothetical protein [Streptomyces]|uniref:Uncharacterized protein n=2 Tax=Streptomyces TaxID=1883 RepID=A0A100Y9M2_9ACTN|nr:MULTISPECIES: hypothetical protein [Streptomyces]KUH40290.1 hypothetical protein ATE80_03085 [Streptomyces kanasensis]UUS34285.1 hypothetical protein NRO40_27945 [Streptomyces changanensis]
MSETTGGGRRVLPAPARSAVPDDGGGVDVEPYVLRCRRRTGPPPPPERQAVTPRRPARAVVTAARPEFSTYAGDLPALCR